MQYFFIKSRIPSDDKINQGVITYSNAKKAFGAYSNEFPDDEIIIFKNVT